MANIVKRFISSSLVFFLVFSSLLSMEKDQTFDQIENYGQNNVPTLVTLSAEVIKKCLWTNNCKWLDVANKIPIDLKEQLKRIFSSHTFSYDFDGYIVGSNGKILIVKNFSGSLTVHDVKTGSCLNTIEAEKAHEKSGVSAIEISRDYKLVCTGSDDGIVKVWDLKTGKCLQTLKHGKPIKSIVISLDNKLVASVFSNNMDEDSVKVWHIGSGKCLQVVERPNFWSHSEPIFSVAISLDNQFLLTGSEDYTIKVWNIKTGECIQTLRRGGKIRSILPTRDNKFAIICGDQKVEILSYDDLLSGDNQLSYDDLLVEDNQLSYVNSNEENIWIYTIAANGDNTNIGVGCKEYWTNNSIIKILDTNCTCLSFIKTKFDSFAVRGKYIFIWSTAEVNNKLKQFLTIWNFDDSIALEKLVKQIRDSEFDECL